MKQSDKRKKRIVTIGSVMIEWHEDFRLYLISYNSLAHFKPDVLSKVNLLNFSITPSGLMDQMLSIAV